MESGATAEQITQAVENFLHSEEKYYPLYKVRSYLRENFKDGSKCPACGQQVKLYPRKITSAMAYGLILLAQSDNYGFFHIEDYLKTQNCPSSIRGDIPKLRHFGLIEKQEGVKEDGNKRNGLYRVTERGRMFVKKQTTVQSHVNLYNNTVCGFSETYIDIEDALTKKFNYSELMTK